MELSSSSDSPDTNNSNDTIDIGGPGFNPPLTAFDDFHGSVPINLVFAARSKVLRSLEISPSVGAQRWVKLSPPSEVLEQRIHLEITSRQRNTEQFILIDEEVLIVGVKNPNAFTIKGAIKIQFEANS
ncbi:hypothetical protein L2E82_20315 [Cichorium intybus]|uniref:Uncharacterized protein n=1 Tax=Cichorium intybus TaxID=13427 RepID=A0ACB9DSN8_CICIN|nr:hypothetical protein L2E82_20315 [Cichorium intybus]